MLAKAAAMKPDHLTDSEWDVLAYIAEGLSNGEIAAERGVTEGTIKTQVHATMAVLGARNRAHAVALAYHAGYLVAKA